MTSERKSSLYFIPQSKFLLSENALGNPDLIQSSVTSDCTVTIVDSDNFALTELEEWPSFSLRATDIRLTAGEGAYNIYIVVPKDDSVRSYASIGFSVFDLDRFGLTASGQQVGDADYRFYKAGTVTAQGGDPSASVTPAGKGRAITMDLGTTPPVVNLPDEVNDYAKVFDITKPDAQNSNSWYMRFLIPIRSMIANVISGVQSLIFGEGDAAREVNSVATSADGTDDHEASDTEIATTGWVIASFGSLDSKYLRKDIEDTAQELLRFLKGLKIGEGDKGITEVDSQVVATLDKAVVETLSALLSLTSSNYTAGDLGAGFRIWEDEEGISHCEIDNLSVRRVAYFLELMIKRMTYVGGQVVLSPASMQCSAVEEYPGYYRCFFNTTDGTRTIQQEFVEGDQARCQTFNLASSEGVGNTYYWRLVVGVGEDYIDLSKSDCDAGSGVPLSGDDIVQLGNRTDTLRQHAIVLSTYGTDAPAIKQYAGVNNYSLTGKEVTILSPSGNKITGDFYASSGKSLIDTINELQSSTGDTFTIWFYDHEPTLSNLPASEWNTEELLAAHEYDIFYYRDLGGAWRFRKDEESGEYLWKEITDQDTIRALEKASKAEDRATYAYKALGLTDEQIEAGETLVSWANGKFSAESYGFVTDEDGKVTNLKSATLLSTAAYNQLTNSDIEYNEDGSVKKVNSAGLVTSSNFSGLFSEQKEKNELVSRADIFTEITDDGQSHAVIKADLIDLKGKLQIENITDSEGNTIIEGGKIKSSFLDVDTILGEDAQFSGSIYTKLKRIENSDAYRLASGSKFITYVPATDHFLIADNADLLVQISLPTQDDPKYPLMSSVEHFKGAHLYMVNTSTSMGENREGATELTSSFLGMESGKSILFYNGVVELFAIDAESVVSNVGGTQTLSAIKWCVLSHQCEYFELV